MAGFWYIGTMVFGAGGHETLLISRTSFSDTKAHCAQAAPQGKTARGVLYQLVPMARIPKRLRFYEDAAKAVRKRMEPKF